MHTHIYHTHTLCLLILQGLLGYLLGPRYWSFMWSCFSPVRFLLPVRWGRQAGHMKRFTQGFHSKEEAGFQTRVSSVPIQCYFCCRKPGRWFYPNQILGPHPRPTELGCPPLAMVWILTGDQEDAVSKRPVSLACWAFLESYPSCYALGIFFFFFTILYALWCPILPSGRCREGIIWHGSLSKPCGQDQRAFAFKGTRYHGNCSPHLISRNAGWHVCRGGEGNSELWVWGSSAKLPKKGGEAGRKKDVWGELELSLCRENWGTLRSIFMPGMNIKIVNGQLPFHVHSGLNRRKWIKALEWGM